MPQVVKARPGSRGIDTNTKITPAIARALAAWRDPADNSRIEFVIRYLSFSGQKTNPRGDLDAGEAADILAAGLRLGFVQHVRLPGWSPSSERGAADALTAVGLARACGAQPEVTIFYDVEGPAPGPVANIIAYDAGFVPVIKSAGFVPGGYFGYGLGLTDEEMWNLGVERYWRAGGDAPPDPANCGYCMRQFLPFDQEICGIKVDFNVVQPDRLGRVPSWLAV